MSGIKIKLVVREVVYKHSKNGEYHRGIGIYHLKHDDVDINPTSTQCTVIPLDTLCDTGAPTTYAFPAELYNVRITNDRIGNVATFWHFYNPDAIPEIKEAD